MRLLLPLVRALLNLLEVRLDGKSRLDLLCNIIILLSVSVFCDLKKPNYLRIASDSLHGGKNSFSRGESLPTGCEEQRLLSVGPKNDPGGDFI